MFLKSLYLYHFRNFEKERVSFSSGINLLVGHNAQGKTNLAEAVYLLITGRSFRSTHLAELIRHEAPGFHLEASVEKDGVEQSMAMSLSGNRRKILINRTLCPTTASLIGFLKGVLIGPHDRLLIGGGPALRRRYLDIQLVQTDSLYRHHLERYYGAMKHRNALLRQRRLQAITPWEQEMASSGAYIVWCRQRTIKQLVGLAQIAFRQLACFEGELDLLYLSNVSEVSQFDRMEHP